MNPTAGGSSPHGLTTSATVNQVTTAAKVGNAAASAHESIEEVADSALAQVNRLSGSAHQAVNNAADAATAASNWAMDAADQVQQTASNIGDSACASIRARPLATMAGALVIGYLIGRLKP